MKKRTGTMLRDFLIIAAIFVISTLILYASHWLFTPFKLQLIYQNWDGPSYVVIAKSFYNPELIDKANTLRLPATHFAAHFPLYPLFIFLFSFMGYFRAMIFVSLVFALLFLYVLYVLIKELYPKLNPLLVVLPFIVITPRWFTVYHVGSSEPAFLFFIALALLYMVRKKWWLSAVFAALAQLTRSQGILFFAGLSLYYAYQFLMKKQSLKEIAQEFFPYILIPLSLCAVFLLYQIQYHDFFAFFHTIAQYHHLQLPPFKVFIAERTQMSQDIWQEAIIYNYILYAGVFLMLFRQKLHKLAFISLLYFVPLPFLTHVDVARYSLSLLPFAAIAYAKILSNKYVLLLVTMVTPAIIVYAFNFMLFNLSP